ncbi:copper-binding protein [Paraburkholderia sp. SOS3]|jgi:Cu(I)/Ag(I) efflux system protein CusF|uniref:copper-binding protein n=1 Tax=Paraburkholderia sp. SOS3 TaxID=1926494 RepID=UPI00094773B7|nr:copper-binding protein [Paraburkholderia sp. SOS3]APR38168.1 RND transporter MFP subunit [Paraburkholderia sp. SOS3]
MKKSSILFISLAAAATSSAAFADDMTGMKMSAGAMSHAPAAGNDAMTDAVVKHVDTASGMVTLKHGALANVGMPAMTMAFKAKEPAMARSVKQGDNVKVRVENVDGTLTIVKMARQ